MRTKGFLGCLAAAALAPVAARGEATMLTWASSAYADGAGAPLRAPEGVACDAAGGIVVADTGNARLVRYAEKDGALAPGAEVRAPQLVDPVRVQLDAAGNALVLDRKGWRLLRFDAKGAYVGTLAPKDAPGFEPVAFKLDPSGGVWILDAGSRRIVLLGADGAIARAVALPAAGIFTDLAVDPAGTVYAVEAMQSQVWSAAKDATALAPLSKPLKDELSFPTYVSIVAGRLLVVDQNGSGIVVVGTDGNFQGRHLGMGRRDGVVYYPGQFCVNASNELFLADRNNDRVQRFTLAR